MFGSWQTFWQRSVFLSGQQGSLTLERSSETIVIKVRSPMISERILSGASCTALALCPAECRLWRTAGHLENT